MSSPFEVKKLVTITIDGKEYKGEVAEDAMENLEKLGKAFSTKLTAYEKSRDDLLDALSEAGVERVVEAPAPSYIARPAKRTAGTSPDRTMKLAQIRAWAKEAGYEVSDRGRVPTEIEEAYDKAHS
ncbi:Lsr2 family protein [Streptomyces yunnanensis]|uniref:Lsr2 family protein n=1 Tax=Streptomyces yunnanensis TaxID=156453 RepID=A0ABY8A1M4_9ACTN|nr:histone-like nucleoid-structuring protein Lsr2 [Streptomyces yunnanensis]WEB38788.1 Lsr2 family protein [Streptomyces yunnanensis]